MLLWYRINEERDDKSFIEAEGVSWLHGFQNMDMLETGT
jgi:hypothetical protein